VRLQRSLCSKFQVPSSKELKDFIKKYSAELHHAEAWKSDPGGAAQNLLDDWTERHGVDGQLSFYRAVGCDKCNKTGYKGRIGLHELMIAEDAAKKLIQERSRVAELFSSAVSSGMHTLKMDGMEKVLMGLTDLKMVRSVCIK
jgi:type II secretory ATPase GspE/PulE/Tfp pilus assembly ATPase PilB-like protein